MGPVGAGSPGGTVWQSTTMKVKFAVFTVALWTCLLSSNVQAQTTQLHSNLKLALPPAVPGSWGADYNNNFVILDTANITLGLVCTNGQVPVWQGAGFTQCASSLPSTPARVTSANKPAAPLANQVVVVTDAFNATTCLTGGGTSVNICQWTGSTWVVVGGVELEEEYPGLTPLPAERISALQWLSAPGRL